MNGEVKAAVTLLAVGLAAHQLLGAYLGEMPPAWLGVLGFIAGAPVAVHMRGWRRVALAGVVGAAAFVAIAVGVVAEALVDPSADPYVDAENAALLAAWLVMSAFGWLAAVAAVVILRAAVDALRPSTGRRRERPAPR